MKNLKYLKRYALFLLVVAIGVCTNVYAQETIISYTVTCSGSNQKSMVYKTEAEARAYFKSCKTGVYLTPRYFYDLTKTSSSSAKSSASSSSSSRSVSSSSSSSSVRTYTTLTFEPPENVALVTIKEYIVNRSDGEPITKPAEGKLMTVTPVKPFTKGEIVTVTAVYNNGTQSLPVPATYE